MRSALLLAVATVAGGFVGPATTRTRHLGVGLLVPITAVPALALRSIPPARSSPTSHRCSPTSMGPPGRSGRRLGGRQPDEQPPAVPPRTDEQQHCHGPMSCQQPLELSHAMRTRTYSHYSARWQPCCRHRQPGSRSPVASYGRVCSSLRCCCWHMRSITPAALIPRSTR